jgi:hypothetical protein
MEGGVFLLRRQMVVASCLLMLIAASVSRGGEERVDPRAALATAQEMLAEGRMKKNLARWVECSVVIAAVYQKFVKGRSFELGKVSQAQVLGFRKLLADRCDVRHDPRKVLAFVDECYPKVKYGPSGYPLLLARLAMQLRKKAAGRK